MKGITAVRARCGLLFGLTVAACAIASPAEPYLEFNTPTSRGVVTARWSRFPVRYTVVDRDAPGVDARQFRDAVGRAFATWQNVPTASISFEFAGFVSASPLEDDGITALGFLDRPELERVLGGTALTFDTVTGEIVEADVFFNAAFRWSVTAAGEPERFDLESIALHEIGHLAGLGHSALGETEPQAGGGRRVIGAEAIMFPTAFAAGNVSGRSLRADDVAGVSDVYPDGNFSAATSSLRGRVSKNGQAVVGAHVVAFDLRTGALVGGFTVNAAGEFAIAGLAPGLHVVRVEPLDDADVAAFFDDPSVVDTNFVVTFHEHVVVLPRGAAVGPIDIRVTPK